ncbi:FGGY-family carbohydrate kinase [Thiothrix fructosivorans]|uniref:FGGY-family carbohydrate kinase n=1 Tax=Thiothrix fructosivorans TaxID=111770 RepID=A0A8B0SF88_9GAMM|nr:FGGY-family carbohydrate kinase [Thiothrix fructosivorans]QTX09724.1 FGGY-family carbohydrate kinase [Thiothrix fructosivorans]
MRSLKLPAVPNNSCYYAGIDLGTSGCRLIVIDGNQVVRAEARVIYPANIAQTPDLWWAAVQQVLAELPAAIREHLRGIAVDGTSGTLLLADAAGNPTTPALMYNDARALLQAQRIAALAPRESGAHGVTSSLAKLLWLLEAYPDQPHAYALHQADWIAGKLAGHFGFSDENNCLKLGYDPVKREWSAWVKALVPEALLPKVYAPGDRIVESLVHAGTTDSIAAFIATGASELGDAVTSLGSTIALKIISDKPIFAPEFGIYSHRLGDKWLAGGASNSGGAVLLQYFSRDDLQRLTPQLRPEIPTGLDYYPLTKTGERFPHANPQWLPRLTPRPADDVQFLQALLEGMSRIEQEGWQRLHELGAPYPKTLRTVGGGSRNPAWMQMRAKLIGVSLVPSKHDEAAFGAALLACGTMQRSFQCA